MVSGRYGFGIDPRVTKLFGTPPITADLPEEIDFYADVLHKIAQRAEMADATGDDENAELWTDLAKSTSSYMMEIRGSTEVARARLRGLEIGKAFDHNLLATDADPPQEWLDLMDAEYARLRDELGDTTTRMREANFRLSSLNMRKNRRKDAEYRIKQGRGRLR